ncbi:hypothetical protein BBO_09478 [Beauveria brongniartii RCEF 3172]|uniref:Uncharacterized protein n=1 Tax=Beauveria brongniartii RCEF 3172 TaxID=1081107 RepID=A0A168FDG4_9HYPO|nr:hypothetical protein BBO_09478 [Beauveria brongniartii RCEF 3172]
MRRPPPPLPGRQEMHAPRYEDRAPTTGIPLTGRARRGWRARARHVPDLEALALHGRPAEGRRATIDQPAVGREEQALRPQAQGTQPCPRGSHRPLTSSQPLIRTQRADIVMVLNTLEWPYHVTYDETEDRFHIVHAADVVSSTNTDAQPDEAIPSIE